MSSLDGSERDEGDKPSGRTVLPLSTRGKPGQGSVAGPAELRAGAELEVGGKASEEPGTGIAGGGMTLVAV